MLMKPVSRAWILGAGALLLAGSACAQPAGGGRGAVREACQADMQRLCSGVQPGGGGRRQSLSQHQAELSDACRSAIMAARGHRGAQGAPPNGPPGPPQS
jgi:hypothetical protein